MPGVGLERHTHEHGAITPREVVLFGVSLRKIVVEFEHCLHVVRMHAEEHGIEWSDLTRLEIVLDHVERQKLFLRWQEELLHRMQGAIVIEHHRLGIGDFGKRK